MYNGAFFIMAFIINYSFPSIWSWKAKKRMGNKIWFHFSLGLKTLIAIFTFMLILVLMLVLMLGLTLGLILGVIIWYKAFSLRSGQNYIDVNAINTLEK